MGSFVAWMCWFIFGVGCIGGKLAGGMSHMMGYLHVLVDGI